MTEGPGRRDAQKVGGETVASSSSHHLIPYLRKAVLPGREAQAWSLSPVIHEVISDDGMPLTTTLIA